MSFFLLSEEFKTGVPEIDEPHEKICELVNDLHALTKTEPDLQTIYNRIDSLVDFIADHHLSEEKLMLDHDYPKFAEHKKEHEYFSKIVIKLVTELKESTTVTPTDLLMATRGPTGWFFAHTKKYDQELADFLKCRNKVA